MASDTIFHSRSSEPRWIHHITQTLENHTSRATDKTRVCIFRVPTTLSAVKPEAYAPQRIGLGPYHHFRPNLYHKMERTKLEVVKSSLKPTDQIPNPQHLLIDTLKKLEPKIRACYDNYLDFNGDTLAWVIAIDALFLLHILCSYNPGGSVNIYEKLVQDIMMLENQIPLILVKEVQKAIHPLSNSNSELEIRAFCDAHSPLKLPAIYPALHMQILADLDADSPLALPQLDYSYHLLGFMYKEILHRERSPLLSATGARRAGTGIVAEAFRQLLSMAGLSLDTLNLFTCLINFVWNTFFALFGKKSDEKNSPVRVKKIPIPSASDLSRTGGVKFHLLTDGVIQYIKFNSRTPSFYLPMITLNVDSEVILRNLLAYESCLDTPGPHKLADYIDLMSGIIHTAKDVELLRDKEIVKGTHTNDQIVDLFNEISNSITNKPNQKSYLENTIQKVNQHFDSLLRVKALRHMKNCVAALWKLLVLISAIFMLVLLGSNAFCEIFGCKNHLFKKAAPNDVGFADHVSSLAL